MSGVRILVGRAMARRGLEAPVWLEGANAALRTPAWLDRSGRPLSAMIEWFCGGSEDRPARTRTGACAAKGALIHKSQSQCALQALQAFKRQAALQAPNRHVCPVSVDVLTVVCQ